MTICSDCAHCDGCNKSYSDVYECDYLEVRDGYIPSTHVREWMNLGYSIEESIVLAGLSDIWI